jgi:hypothetical protein
VGYYSSGVHRCLYDVMSCAMQRTCVYVETSEHLCASFICCRVVIRARRPVYFCDKRRHASPVFTCVCRTSHQCFTYNSDACRQPVNTCLHNHMHKCVTLVIQKPNPLVLTLPALYHWMGVCLGTLASNERVAPSLVVDCWLEGAAALFRFLQRASISCRRL